MPWGDVQTVQYTTPKKNPVMGVKASIIGIRSQDLVAMRWYSVYPEKEPAYCAPLPKKLHVIFGAKNVGDEDGNLFGRLLSNGKVLINGRKQLCTVGAFVYWEKDLDMPFAGLDLEVRVGHNGVVDDTYSFRIESSAKIPYDYIWEWEGHTNKATFTWGEKLIGGMTGTQPPPDVELIERAKTAYHGVILADFVSEFAKQGVDVSFVNVLPSAWVERSSIRELPNVVARRYGCKWMRSQDITVHVAGKVFFNSSEDLMGSPLEPTTIAALVTIAKYAIAAILTALTVIVIAKLFFDWITVTSEVTKTTKITLPEDTHIEEDLKLPDGTVIKACQTLPAGTVLEWSQTDTTKEPAMPSILILGLLFLGAMALAPRVVREVRRE